MRYLLDTKLVSELRKRDTRADRQVLTWARAQVTSDLAISVITVMEIEIGVARLERRDPRQGARLRQWLEHDVLGAFESRILPVDLAVARRAAGRHVPDPRPERDVLIAATAATHRLVVVTRNIADLAPLSCDYFDPWATPST